MAKTQTERNREYRARHPEKAKETQDKSNRRRYIPKKIEKLESELAVLRDPAERIAELEKQIAELKTELAELN